MKWEEQRLKKKEKVALNPLFTRRLIVSFPTSIESFMDVKFNPFSSIKSLEKLVSLFKLHI